MIKLLFKFVISVMALGLVMILAVYFLPSATLTNSKQIFTEPFLPSATLTNSKQIFTEPFFTKEMVDTEKLVDLNLNPYCIYDLLESEDGEINYKSCLEKHKDKIIISDVYYNFDGPTGNINTSVFIEDTTFYFSLADFFGDPLTGEGFYYYEYFWNGGGTGTFSSIKGVELRNNMLTLVSNIEGGDRCNDGYIDYISVDRQTGSVNYAKSATPFRLLNYKDGTDWRRMSLANSLSSEDDEENSESTLEDFAKSQGTPGLYDNLSPYDDIDNCALCCIGHTINKFDVLSGEIEPVGITLKKSSYGAAKVLEESCFYDWIAEENFKQYESYSENDKLIYLDQQDWARALKSFSSKCTLDLVKKVDKQPL